MNQPTNRNTRARKYLTWLFWIAVWQVASFLIHNNVISVGPLDMIKALAQQIAAPSFRTTTLNSFVRTSLGFPGVFFLGALLGSLVYLFLLVKELLDPVVLLIKSIPIISFVILALIQIGSHNLAVFTSFLAVVPMVYVSTLSGLEYTDKKLLGMARVLRMSVWKRIRYIYVSALLLYLVSGCRTALRMSWKSDMATEVTDIPEGSIGEQLYYPKLHLDTVGLFSWTFVITVISALFERLFPYLLGRIKHQGAYMEWFWGYKTYLNHSTGCQC